MIICEPTPNPAGRSVTIKFISCDSTLLAGVLDRLAEYYGSSAPKAYRALRINAPDSTPIAEQLDRSDRHLGFSLVGTLPNELDFITARDVSKAADRNERKAAALLELAGARELKHRKRAVPYDVYFMSRNLEHALYGFAREFSDDEKRRLSAAFGRKYRNDPKGFIELLRSGDVRVPGDTAEETWHYTQEGTNSLHRDSNLHLFFSGSYRPPL